MTVTIFLGIFLLVFVVALVMAVTGWGDLRGQAVIAAIATGLVTAVIAAFSCFVIVPTRDIGIVTTFGRPVGELSNGLHAVAPWQNVTNMDGAIQLQQFNGSNFDNPDDAVQVRLGNNSTAFVNININWRIDPKSAPQLFLDYRTFENIRQNLVDKQLQVSASKEFANFNPQQQTQGVDLPGLAKRIKDDLQAAVGDRVEIMQVFVPGIFYDGPTQDRINQFNVEAQNTKVAEQSVKTAEQRKRANDIIAQSVQNDPMVIVAQCINESLAKNQPVSGCWPLGGQPLLQVTPPPR